MSDGLIPAAGSYCSWKTGDVGSSPWVLDIRVGDEAGAPGSCSLPGLALAVVAI